MKVSACMDDVILYGVNKKILLCMNNKSAVVMDKAKYNFKKLYITCRIFRMRNEK
jgi:hypothetical protein